MQKIDWAAERLSFQVSNVSIPATHIRRSLKSKNCSVTTQTRDGQTVAVVVARKYIISAAHEALVRVSSTARPQKTIPGTLALVEPRIVSAHTLDGIPQDEIWHTLIVARTVTQWCRKTKSALVHWQSLRSDHYPQAETIVGTISPVTVISPRTASAITHNHSESQARIDLTAALDESFKNSTFNGQQKTQLLDLCAQYRSVFSLTREELGRCTIAEAEFPLQKNTKPVDRRPYRTNPKAQEVIDKYAENMDSVGIVEKKPNEWGSPVCICCKS